MAIVYGGVQPPREREYLYIDGGALRDCVRRVSRELFNDENAYQPYIPAVASGSYDKIFYYDAVPGRDYGEAQAAYEARVEPDHERFATIQALDRVHVALGQIVGKERRQKGVDVRLAVDMMTHAFRGNIAKATLFAADADFVPLVEALVREGIHVTLWHPPQANGKLRGAADSTRPFTFAANYACFTSDGVQSAFQPKGSGSGPENSLKIYNIMKTSAEGEYRYGARWKDDTITLCRCDKSGQWYWQELYAPGATRERTMMVLETLWGWKLSDRLKEWVIGQ